MSFFLTILISLLIIGLFLYSKLLPYKDRLIPPYKGIFGFFDSIYTPMCNVLKSIFKPFKVGQGLSIDMTQVILLVLLLALAATA